MPDHETSMWLVHLTDEEKKALSEAAEYVMKRYWGTGDRAFYSQLLAKLRDAPEASTQNDEVFQT